MADKTVTVRLQALVTGYQAAMARATASTQAFGAAALKSAGQNQTAFNTLGLGAVVLGGALVGGLAAAAAAAIEFESSFAGVRKTVDGTEEELQAISDGLREMATQIPVNVNELARIAEAAGALGVAKGSILEFTALAAKLGVTTDLSSDMAATGIARLTNIMQTANVDMGRLGATLVDLGNNGASTESEILDFSLRLAGAGKIAGLTEADVLGISNAMASLGIQSERGGTAAQKVLLGITTAVNTGSDNLERFAAVAGMSAAEFTQTWEADPGEAFVRFVEGLGGSGQDAIGILAQLNLTDTRLVQSFLSLSGAGDILRNSVELGSRAWEENNALNEEAAKRFDTTAAKVQLAKNEINDAAISFGQLLLPVLAAGVGVLGDLASFISALPGPVKVAVLAFMGLGGALALVSGAALLLAPRIAQINTMLAAAGIKTGMFRGGLMLAARAINPVSLGITALVVGLGIYISKQQEAKSVVEGFTEALKADAGAIAENSEAFVVHELQTRGLLEAYKAAGVSGQELVQMVFDLVAAYQSGDKATIENAQLALYNGEVHGAAADKVLILVNRILEAESAYKGEADAARGGAVATDEAAEAADEFGNTIATELNPELTETIDLAKELSNALDVLAGAQLDARKASLKWLDTLADTRKELRHGLKTLDENTKAGRDNQQAILNSIDAAIDHGAAVAEETGSLDKGVRATQAHIRELMNEAVQAGFSKKEIREYIDQLNLTPKELKTLLSLEGVDKASDEIDEFIRTNDGRVIGLRVVTKGGFIPHQDPDIPHAGGLVGSSGFKRYHGGGLAGWPPMRGNEVAAILERGEMVLSKGQVRHGAAASTQMAGILIEGVLDTAFGPAHIRAVVKGELAAERAFDDRLARMAR